VRLLECLRGEPVSDFEGKVGIEDFSRRVQPHSAGLADRVWYGGGMSSAIWAGRQGINYLTSSVVSIEGTDSRDFATIQGENILCPGQRLENAFYLPKCVMRVH
jgi:hypothetical protein